MYGLLECYSDLSAVKIMNSGRCASDFHYTTTDEMKNCIRFWLGEYAKKAYVRFSIIDKQIQKAVGSIEMFGAANLVFSALIYDQIMKSKSTSRSYSKYRIHIFMTLFRTALEQAFDFDYKWEIYTPVSQRKYGYYVLPVLFGNRFVGRIEIAVDKKAKQLSVRNFWQEKRIELDKDFHKCLQARLILFASFNQSENFVIQFEI